ncbi:MAG: HAMP domain-containing histidine kinase [Ruminococcus sp.]|nr:HAMP domain-containing histidine kinase [Ruminococcus sp.]
MKLFPKTFLHCLCLMVGIVLIAFTLIYVLLPSFYKNYTQSELDKNTETLIQQLEKVKYDDLSSVISSYAVKNNYGLTATNEKGERIGYVGSAVSYEVEGAFEDNNPVTLYVDLAESERKFRTADGQEITLMLRTSLQPIEDALNVLMMILPIVLLLCVLLSAAVAYCYAKSIAKPIKSLTASAIKMQTLDKDAYCYVNRKDEIGILSQNMNKMYEKLLTTISQLEHEIDNVSKSEQEKLDFLLMASHELKTPITAVRGMVDGMVYNVGIYKDRDVYLLKCQKALEDLTELLCRVLETAKIDASTAAKKRTETDIGELLKEVTDSYSIIAQSRSVEMTLSLKNDFTANISAELIEKALSNLISNAVKYTGRNKAVKIYMKDRTVYIENECKPLDEEELSHIKEPFYRPDNTAKDSTGLGLYFTDRILSACGLSYSFKPYEKGMRFILEFV